MHSPASAHSCFHLLRDRIVSPIVGVSRQIGSNDLPIDSTRSPSRVWHWHGLCFAPPRMRSVLVPTYRTAHRRVLCSSARATNGVAIAHRKDPPPRARRTHQQANLTRNPVRIDRHPSHALEMLQESQDQRAKRRTSLPST